MKRLIFFKLAFIALLIAIPPLCPAHAGFIGDPGGQIEKVAAHPKQRFELARDDGLEVYISAAKEPQSQENIRWWHLWLYEPSEEVHFGVIHFSLEKDTVLLIGMALKEEKRGQRLSYFMINLLYQFAQETGRAFGTMPIKKPVLIKVLNNLLLKPRDTNYPFYICRKGKERTIYAQFDFPKSYTISQGISLLEQLPPNFEKDCQLYYAHTAYVLNSEDEQRFLARLAEKSPTLN